MYSEEESLQRRLAVVEYAYNHVPFYKRMSRQTIKDWESVPIITKSVLSENNSSMIAEDYIGDYLKNNLIVSHTSGSSGMPVEVYWSQHDYNLSLLPLWLARFRMAGIHPRDKVCYFNCFLNCGEYDVKKQALIISKRNLTYDRLKKHVEMISQFAPKWMLLHPNIALMLCEILEKEKISLPSVSYIELTGEMILPSVKQRLKENFNCLVKGHYGTMEVNTIGIDSGNCYRIFDDSTYVEILDENGTILPDGKTGDIYVTSLHNEAMPIIRLRTDDIGKIETVEENGTRVKVLYLERTRRDLYILDKFGRRIRADVLLEPIDILFGMMGERIVYQIRAKQVSKTELSIEFVLDKDFEEEVFLQHYLSNLDTVVIDNFSISFSFLSRIREVSEITGKINWFESCVL